MITRSLIPWRNRRLDARLADNPFDVWESDFSQLFNGLTSIRPFGLENGESIFRPRVNVADREDEIEITVELPGMSEEEIDISLKDNQLTIKGEKKLEREESEGSYRKIERRYGSFCRSVRFSPDEIDLDNASATFVNGVLAVTLPKLAEKQTLSKRIPVKAG